MSQCRYCQDNSWDNVRVVRGAITLRCRRCQRQLRGPMDKVWRQWRCKVPNCSSDKRCGRFHIHHRKQTLVERVANMSPEMAAEVINRANQRHSTSLGIGFRPDAIALPAAAAAWAPTDGLPSPPPALLVSDDEQPAPPTADAAAIGRERACERAALVLSLTDELGASREKPTG